MFPKLLFLPPSASKMRVQKVQNRVLLLEPGDATRPLISLAKEECKIELHLQITEPVLQITRKIVVMSHGLQVVKVIT